MYRMMNPKYRPIYLSLGFAGLIILIYHILSNLSDLNPVTILTISLPDMAIFLLAYRTYPIEEEVPREHYINR